MAQEYKKIEAEMKLWRQGLTMMPKAYIDYHKELAENALKELIEENPFIQVHNTYMNRCGWGDGMELLNVVIEARGKLAKLVWNDSHSKGKWFIKSESGGSFPFNPAKDI